MDKITFSPQSICDANSRKWSCPACTYLNWPKANRCTQCETLRDQNLNNARDSPSPDGGNKYKTRDRLSNLFESLKLTEWQPSSFEGENTRIGPMNSTSAKKEHSYNGADHPLSLNIMDNITNEYCSEPSPLICQADIPKEPAFIYNNLDTDNECSSSTHGAIAAIKRTARIASQRIIDDTENQCLGSKGCNQDKWSCVLCTYDNWPRSMKCVMCSNPRGNSLNVQLDSPSDGTHFHSANQGRNASTLNNEISVSANNRIRTSAKTEQNSLPISSNNRRTVELDRLWLQACNAIVDGNVAVVESYLATGGDPSRQLSQTEVEILDRPSAFEVGLTLIHLALRFHQENLLATLLSQVDGTPTVVKRVPSTVAPELAMDVRRHAMSCIKQRRGTFRCHFVSEIVTFTLPSEIEDYPAPLQETLFDEVLDRDVQKELENGQIINWSSEILEHLSTRLYALWNRSSGDCLLDSLLQATWGVFDQDNGLRQALSDSLQECATMFYQRWKENEIFHAHLLQFSLNDSQCAAEWAKLLSIASKPGSSLEQLHIFVLAHILRRPIIVYGVKFVKSFRGETLGYARYEGLYLPLFWESGFCYKSPICLAYTRGHFSALVTIEPDCDPLSGTTSAAQVVQPNITTRCSYLPLTSFDGHLLPIHFLTQAELGKEEMIMNQWLDVRFTDTGLMVACQQVQILPLMVGQMMEEWLNHYRGLGQLGSGTFMRQPKLECYSSEGESED